MKKIIIVISICILFASMSFVSATSIPKIRSLRAQTLDEITADPEDAPEWAVGNFTGAWGLNFWGNDWFAIGSVKGYYGQGFLWALKVGRFLIEYRAEDAENGTLFEGIFFGPYLIGHTTDLQTDNTSAFVGLGGYNETHFRWRIMGMEGPTIFMKGTFNQF